jgi:CheY-like chemotaxis protein
MDVQMPEMDGMEATRRIRAIDGPRGQIPIVALTAQVFTEQVEACREAGMDDHLVKPFTPESLLEVVTRVVAPIRRRPPDAVQREEEVVACRPPSVVAAVESGLSSNAPLFDLTVLERLSGLLRIDVVTRHLQTLAAKIEALLLQLHAPNALVSHSDALADSAHVLAGGAGMFGFARLAQLARHFERAVQTGSEDTVPLLDDLSITLAVTLEEVRSRITILVSA